ncbi:MULTISPECIES: N-formylglutamate deformylase [Comamonas]|uniref:N-formylglutamate amidohydrolase n=1 Tax=Comamonas thiooxydans TaxID=363952 RepID=A0A454XTJ0_9BURK|nr:MULTISPECIES: N-formylglutamate deformylase [Comamonas]ACY30921.1 N-formylglutamate amidohydrolase [Comamonas thiooxydans]KGG84623.1 N-formylglutamate amidohydrolase [Comamonas thiooxydans]KGG87227.1 N-formylglutamate amidohydrolase [Comamonas thiooxydans]MDH1332594.1 N-formylglutamate deformylase [Comamonas thiooxydans]MDH1739605.1 N-formylglutamate deformylase [Comamonas thiooxydans]
MSQAIAPFVFHQGTAPLLISMPHTGTHVPADIAARLTPEGREVHDTDWHMPQLYDFAKALGASILVATHSRYVIDLNRPPDGASLYPGQSVTGLCPVDGFDSKPLYASKDLEPDEAEVARRRELYWQPYHAQLRAELDRIKSQHGVAMLWDAHSIRSVLPRFFEGKLPDLNLGTADGKSCAPALAQQLLDIARQAPDHTSVLNGRFKGGFITRNYGQPEQGFHAVQLEMTQSSYMQEQMPFDYLPEVAARIQPTMQRLLQAVLAFAQASGR